MNYQQRINAARTLDELCSVLNQIETEIEESRTGALTDTNIGEHVNLAGLPTFGGPEPANTLGIWSWDETRYLGADGSHWSIGER